jgi:hypothetical protein
VTVGYEDEVVGHRLEPPVDADLGRPGSVCARQAPTGAIAIHPRRAANGDGIATFGFKVGNSFALKNGRSPGPADVSFAYGLASDEVLVGDWNGDGRDTLAVRRARTYYLKNSFTGGPADVTLSFGLTTDEAYVGDRNRDGKDTLGVPAVIAAGTRSGEDNR